MIDDFWRSNWSKPIRLLTNRNEDVLVKTPAYSLTKMLQSGALVVTAVVGVLTARLPEVEFSSWQIVALTSALLGFLAVTASADVLSRGYAAAAQSRGRAADAAVDDGKTAVSFSPSIRSELVAASGETAPVKVLAARGSPPQFLIDDGGGRKTWVGPERLRF